MSFSYGCDTHIRRPYFAKGVTTAGTYGPLGVAAGGCSVITVTAATDCVVSGLKVSIVTSLARYGGFTAPARDNVLLIGGESYQAGEDLGRFLVPVVPGLFLKAVIEGTITSGSLDITLDYFGG